MILNPFNWKLNDSALLIKAGSCFGSFLRGVENNSNAFDFDFNVEERENINTKNININIFGSEQKRINEDQVVVAKNPIVIEKNPIVVTNNQNYVLPIHIEEFFVDPLDFKKLFDDNDCDYDCDYLENLDQLENEFKDIPDLFKSIPVNDLKRKREKSPFKKVKKNKPSNDQKHVNLSTTHQNYDPYNFFSIPMFQNQTKGTRFRGNTTKKE